MCANAVVGSRECLVSTLTYVMFINFGDSTRRCVQNEVLRVLLVVFCHEKKGQWSACSASFDCDSTVIRAWLCFLAETRLAWWCQYI